MTVVFRPIEQPMFPQPGDLSGAIARPQASPDRMPELNIGKYMLSVVFLLPDEISEAVTT